jgi:WD40 repeat protein
VITASFDGTAQIWDAHTGRPVGEPMNHADMVYDPKFNHNASIVLTFGRSRTARLWDATSSRPLGEPFVHEGEIDDGAFLGQRPVVATISRDKTARLWSVPDRLSGKADDVTRQMSVLTGMELGADDVARVLDVSAWKSQRDAFQAHREQVQP